MFDIQTDYYNQNSISKIRFMYNMNSLFEKVIPTLKISTSLKV